MAKVSIIIPVYNSERTLSACIQSVLQQSFRDFELILCNDGSEDHSLDICRKFEKEDGRIRVYDLPHRGVSAARNEGLLRAAGRYILFSDSDDIPAENWAEFLMDHAVPEGLAVCGYSCVDEQGVRRYGAEKNDGRAIEGMMIERDQFIEDLFSNFHMYQGYIWNKIYDASLIEKHCIRFREGIAFNEDRLFLLSYLFFCHGVSYSNIPLYTYSLDTYGRSAYSDSMMTEIDAFEIMRGALYSRRLYMAYHYACKDEERAVSELLSLAERDSPQDAPGDLERLRELQRDLPLERYDVFTDFLDLHVPVRKLRPAESEKLDLYADYLHTCRKFQAEPMDYFKYRFYALSDDKRAEYLTRRQYARMCEQYDSAQSRENITDKRLFAKVYREYLGREVLSESGEASRREYEKMCGKYRKLICKPVNGGYAEEIRVFSTEDQISCMEVWKRFCEGGCLIEEFISQNEVLASFHPLSVNTIRSVTVISGDGQPSLIAAAIRTGRGDADTDNGNGGGIFAGIDPETGKITGDGATHFGDRYAVHPDTGIRFEGTEIPYWESFKEASLKAAEIQKELRLCCWDWTLKRDGKWALLEGNVEGGIGLNQTALGKGMKRKIEKGLLCGNKQKNYRCNREYSEVVSRKRGGEYTI